MEEYIKDVQELSKEEFVKKHNYAFLFQISESSSSSAQAQMGNTVMVDVTKQSISSSLNNMGVVNIFPLIKKDSLKSMIAKSLFAKKSLESPPANDITIGRGSSQDIVINSTNISKKHAVIKTVSVGSGVNTSLYAGGFLFFIFVAIILFYYWKRRRPRK